MITKDLIISLHLSQHILFSKQNCKVGLFDSASSIYFYG